MMIAPGFRFRGIFLSVYSYKSGGVILWELYKRKGEAQDVVVMTYIWHKIGEEVNVELSSTSTHARILAIFLLL